MDTGYRRIVKMDRDTKYNAPALCYSLDEFTMTGLVGPFGSQLVFEFVNGAWQARFNSVYGTYYYNDQAVKHQDEIIIKDGDSLRVKYKYWGVHGVDVTVYYKEDTLHWSVEEAIKIKEEKWKDEVASLQQQNEKIAIESQQSDAANIEEIRKHKVVEAELRKQIADLQLQQQMQEERCQLAKSMKELQQVAAKQESTNNANIEEIRKQKEVEAELRVKIADLQGALQVQQEVKESDKNQQLPHSRTIDVIRQPSLQFPAILEQIKQNSTQIIEMASIWERERSEMNDKIAKLTQQLKENQDQELLRTQQAMAAMAMLNQVFEGCKDTEKVKESKSSIVSESDISVDNNSCVICEAELGEDSVVEGLHRYCHQCANK